MKPCFDIYPDKGASQLKKQGPSSTNGISAEDELNRDYSTEDEGMVNSKTQPAYCKIGVSAYIAFPGSSFRKPDLAVLMLLASQRLIQGSIQ